MDRFPRPAPWLGLLIGLVLLAVVAASIAHLGGGGGSDGTAAGTAAGTASAPRLDPAAAKAAAQRRAMARIALVKQPVYRGDDTSSLVALSFDDGPAPATLKTLAQLNRLKLHATFFVIGRQIPGNEHELRAIVKHGNEIAVHTWNHPDLTTLTNAQIRSELLDTRDAIRKGVGVDPAFYRPPYGAIDDRVIGAIASARMVPVLWDVNGDDWVAGISAAEISRRVLAAVRPGSIVLLHDGGGPRDQTVKAIPLIQKGLRARGLKPVTVSELLEQDPPALDGAPTRTVNPGADQVPPAG